LSAEMILMGGAAKSLDHARELYNDLIQSGAALEKMREIITAQGGDPASVDDYRMLPKARKEKAVLAGISGYVESIDTEAVGRASMLLGAGRDRLDASIDLGVGLHVEARIGDRVDAGSTLATLIYNDETWVEEAARLIEQAYTIGKERPPPPALIKTVLR
ncbi:MAG TPA: hypothetical protein VFQ92_22120, partial [Blastocatellia bacterium]|nr:hypothetical protein [Blastocatellia bacterium]